MVSVLFHIAVLYDMRVLAYHYKTTIPPFVRYFRFASKLYFSHSLLCYCTLVALGC